MYVYIEDGYGYGYGNGMVESLFLLWVSLLLKGA